MSKIRDNKTWESDMKQKLEKRQRIIDNIEDAERDVRKAFAILNQKIIDLNKLYLEDGREPVDIEDLVFHYLISQASLDIDDKESE